MDSELVTIARSSISAELKTVITITCIRANRVLADLLTLIHSFCALVYIYNSCEHHLALAS